MFDLVGICYDWMFLVIYSIVVLFRFGGDVVVLIKVCVQLLVGVIVGDVIMVKLCMMEGVDIYWNGKFILVVNDLQCGMCMFLICYVIQWVDGGQDYMLQLYKEYDCEMVDLLLVYVVIIIDFWIYVYEFVYILGLFDEYFENEDDVLDMVCYICFDGIVDFVGVEVMVYCDSIDLQVIIMFMYYSVGIYFRYVWNIGCEVQELFCCEFGWELICIVF